MKKKCINSLFSLVFFFLDRKITLQRSLIAKVLKTIMIILFLLTTTAILINCSGENGAEGRDGTNGLDGTDGTNGTNGSDAQGNITRDTTWKSGLTYIIQDKIVVKEGVTLTIEPGAVVSLNPYTAIYIDGTLNAQGNFSDRIIIKNEGIEGGGELKFTSTSSNSIMRYVELQNNSLILSSNSDIQYCKIINVTTAKNYFGLTVSFPSSSCTISNCTLIGYNMNDFGIMTDVNNCLINFTNCIISNFNNGVWDNGLNNTLVFNNCSIINIKNYSISTRGFVTINNSNLYSNTGYDYYNISSNNQNARSNWWGTTDTAAINLKINDKNDNSAYGTVDYSSYQSSEVNVTGCGW